MIKRISFYSCIVLLFITSLITTAQTVAPHITFSKRYGGSGDDHPGKFMQLPDKGYLMSGWTTSHDDQVSGFHGGSDAYLLRTDSAGNFMWGRAVGGSGEDNIFSVDILNPSTYIIGGKTSSSDGDLASLAGPSSKGFIAWVNAATGTIRKIKVYTGNLSGEVKKVIVLDSGRMVVFGQRVCTTPVQTMWVTMMDTAGNVLWEKPYGRGSCCTTFETVGPFIAKKNGGFIATAQTNSVDGDVVGMHGVTNVWMVSLDDTGKIEWAKCYGGSGSCGPLGIAEAPDGGILCGANTSPNDSDVHGTHGGIDFWAFKVDDTGKLIWSRAIGGTANEFLSEAVGTCDGGMVMSGYSWSNDGDITSMHGVFDVFVTRVDSLGNLKWAHNYGTTLGESEGYVTVTRDNGYAFIGFIEATDGDATGIATHGAGDLWFAKLSDDTLGNYCPSTDTPVVHPSSVWSETMAPMVTVFPNPAYSSVTIVLSSNAYAPVVSLYDVTGRALFTGNYATGTNRIAIPVNQLTDGLYTVVVSAGGNRVVTKVSVQH